MIIKIFAVRDSAVEAFLQPFFSPTLGSAIRSITEVVNDPQHTFAKNPTDYALWEIGSFDDASGRLEPIEPIQMLAPLSELVK